MTIERTSGILEQQADAGPDALGACSHDQLH